MASKRRAPLLQGNGLRRFIVGEQVAEARPADEGGEQPLVVLLRHVEYERLQDEVTINRVRGLALQQFVKVTEDPQPQEMLAPHVFLSCRRRPDESLALRFQNCQAPRSVNEVEQLGRLDNRYGAAKLPIGVGRDPKYVLLASAGVEVFE